MNTMKFWFSVAAVARSTVTLTALLTLLSVAFASLVSGQTIVDLAVGSGIHNTLVTAVTTAGLGDALSATDADLTVFAPTDDAFAALDQDFLAMLLTENWRVHLRLTLFHHLVSGVVYSTDIADGLVVDSLLRNQTSTGAPTPLTFSLVGAGGDVFISGQGFTDSKVVAANLNATNGVVHAVDKVFLPTLVCCDNLYDSAAFFPAVSQLIALVDTAGLKETAQTEIMTILGPPNAVFDALPPGTLDTVNVTAVILNHIVLGPPLTSAMLAAGMTITT